MDKPYTMADVERIRNRVARGLFVITDSGRWIATIDELTEKISELSGEGPPAE